MTTPAFVRASRLYDIDEHGRVIREGFRIWQDAGMPEEQYRSAEVRFADGSKGQAWRWLARS